MKKSRLIKFSVLFAFVFSLCFMFFAPSSVAVAEQNRELVQINFVNKAIDKIVTSESQDEEYTGEIYYDVTENKIENENGQEIDLWISTTDNSFDSWFIQNVEENDGFEELNGLTCKTNLKPILQKAYANKEKYVVDGQISLLSKKDSAVTTELRVDSSVNEHGKLYVSGVEVRGKIVLNRNQIYNMKVVPNQHFKVVNVEVFKQNENESFSRSETGEFDEITLSPVGYHVVKAEFAKVDYEVNFVFSNREHEAISDVQISDFINKTSTTGQVDETLNEVPSFQSNNSYRYFRCEVYDLVNDRYDVVNLDVSFSGTFFNNCEVDQTVTIFVIYDQLFEVNVSFDEDLGDVVAYVDNVAVLENCYGEDVLTIYVSALEEVDLFVVPKNGFVVSSVENVDENEINNEKITLKNLSQKREISVLFEEEHYVISVYSYLDNGKTLNGFENYSEVEVEGEKTNKIKAGQRITKIETTLPSDSDYKFEKYQIYRRNGNAWEDCVFGMEITPDYVTAGENKVYVKVVYSRFYRVSVYIDDLSAGAGYFDVKIFDKDNEVIPSQTQRNVTEYSKALEAGMYVYVEAKSFAGYEFNSFTFHSNDNVLIKKIENENLSIGLVFKKVNVDIEIVSKSKNVSIHSLTKDSVSVGEKITIAYDVDFSYKLKNVYINKVRADKLDNVTVHDNAIVIDVTKTFLASLDDEGTILVNVKTTRDAGFVSFVIIIPILITLLGAGAVVSVVFYVKTKKKHSKIEDQEIMK